MARGRQAQVKLLFNGFNVTSYLDKYLTGVTFTDVAEGTSDSVSIDMYDADMIWLSDWYPTKGDIITGGATFERWNGESDVMQLSYGKFIMDSIKFSGGPLKCTFGGLSIPQDRSFKTRQRTKTWENVMISGIGSEIAGRYGLGFSYNAPDTLIESIEQTDRTDSDFLFSVVKDYGLKMKVYNQKLVIFDTGRLEAISPVCTIDRADFIGDGWSYDDELEGTYTGAIVGYKTDESEQKEIKISVGDTSRRVLYINQKCDTAPEAEWKARSQVNDANEKMTKLSGAVWMKQVLYSSQTVKVTGMGKANGKYYIDKITTSITDSGTKQNIEMHKCYARL